MVNYDKVEIRENLDIQDIYELLIEWGGEPEYQGDNVIISRTICHHHPNEEMSKKLYYYDNSKLFQCWTNCGGFDIFELCRKVMSIQHNQNFDLNDAVRWVAYRFGISGSEIEDKENLEDWDILDKYKDMSDLELKDGRVVLKEYDSGIVNRFNYQVKLSPWLNEGISQQALDDAKIGYYPGNDQITIPHYDDEGRLVGIRGRTVCKEEAEKYGKYRPLKVCGTLYSHPLGMNLYNLNNSKNNICATGKAIVFEGEKSCLLYRSYFGQDNDISVASCGSNLSYQQVRMLMDAGAKEIILAFDKQWEVRGNEEYIGWTNKLKKINDKFHNDVLISFIFDKTDLLGYKEAPIDEGAAKFLQLYKKRIIL